MKKYYFELILLLLAGQTFAQFNQTWRGKKCSIVLTYDDAINQHLDNALPVLDSPGLKATFYVTAFSSSVQTRLNEWKKLATRTHQRFAVIGSRVNAINISFKILQEPLRFVLVNRTKFV